MSMIIPFQFTSEQKVNRNENKISMLFFFCRYSIGNTSLSQKRNEKTSFAIPEDTPIGAVFGHVILNDFDSIANGNPYLQLTTLHPPLPFVYKLIYQNSFQNTKIYSLILHTNLDRESKSIHDNMQLLAHDSGTPTLNTRLDILLNVTDVNDCIPRIETNSTILIYNIEENNPLGLIIDTLKARDGDEGLNGDFEFSIVNQTNLLIINPKTGRLSLNESIDFEQFNVSKNETTIDLEFFIEVKDFGRPSLASQTKLILRIHDLNDHAPQFEENQSFNWTFPKSVLRSNSVLGRIIANDADSGLEGIVHYSISSLDSCLILDITSLGYVYVVSQTTCPFATYTFEIIASDHATLNPRSTKQLLFINFDFNNDQQHLISLPQLLPLTSQRAIVDINSLGNISFILDLTTNQSMLPRLNFNNTNLLTCWKISSSGEVRLIDQPYALSYILSLNIIDDYTQDEHLRRIRIDLCNSSIMNSCQELYSLESRKDNEFLLIWAIGLASMITGVCVFIFSIFICLYCRKKQQRINKKTEFLQYHEKAETRSDSTIRDDCKFKTKEEEKQIYKSSDFVVSGDSACVINTNSSSLSSGIIPIRIDRSQSTNEQTYQPSTYFYDIKLAELIRNHPNPRCVHLNSQSFSTDYGFASSEVSPTSTSFSSIQFNQSNGTSFDWHIESPRKQTTKNTFISSHECVV